MRLHPLVDPFFHALLINSSCSSASTSKLRKQFHDDAEYISIRISPVRIHQDVE
jgi:hypothetical protein